MFNRFSSINIALGLWLVAAPFVLGYSNISAALFNDVIIGILVAVVAFLATNERRGAKAKE